MVAYCSLYEYASEPTASYVALLNCPPRLLENTALAATCCGRAVARSTELGYKRLDLHTWPGNMRAVPPLQEDRLLLANRKPACTMLNYLPLILPLASDYFGDADWYKNVPSAIFAVKEDDIVWQGMKGLPLCVRAGWAPAQGGHRPRERRRHGLSRNDDYSVACILDGQELIAGVASPIRWEISNKKTTPLNVSLMASGETGLYRREEDQHRGP